MKKNGFFASLVRGVVEEEKQKYAERPPEMFMNEKKQMWYFLMNQIDRPDGEAAEKTEAGEAEKPAQPEQ